MESVATENNLAEVVARARTAQADYTAAIRVRQQADIDQQAAMEKAQAARSRLTEACNALLAAGGVDSSWWMH
jgi:hypothetical protein